MLTETNQELWVIGPKRIKATETKRMAGTGSQLLRGRAYYYRTGASSTGRSFRRSRLTRPATGAAPGRAHHSLETPHTTLPPQPTKDMSIPLVQMTDETRSTAAPVVFSPRSIGFTASAAFSLLGMAIAWAVLPLSLIMPLAAILCGLVLLLCGPLLVGKALEALAANETNTDPPDPELP